VIVGGGGGKKNWLIVGPVPRRGEDQGVVSLHGGKYRRKSIQTPRKGRTKVWNKRRAMTGAAIPSQAVCSSHHRDDLMLAVHLTGQKREREGRDPLEVQVEGEKDGKNGAKHDQATLAS